MAGSRVMFPVSNSTVAKLSTSAVAASWAKLSEPSHQASGMLASAHARTRSIATCSPRSPVRATSTPAGRPMTSQAA